MDRRLRPFFDGCLLLALLGGVLIGLYGWFQIGDAPAWGRALLVLGLVAAGGASLAFLLPAMWRANLVLVGCATVIGLFGVSAVLAVWFPLSTLADLDERRLAAARQAGIAYDTRRMREVVDDLRSAGVHAYPVVSPAVLPAGGEAAAMPLFPLAGLSNVPTVVCNESGRYLIVENDRYGFNNPDRVHDGPSPVLLLGDSFAFGYCVPPEDNLAGRLRARGFDLVDLGYPGTGPLVQLAQLREYGPPVSPRVVIWLFYAGNDLRNLREEIAREHLRRYLAPGYSQGLARRQSEIDRYLASFVEQARGRRAALQPSTLHEIVTLAPLRHRLGLTRGGQEDMLDLFAEVAERIRAEADALGARLCFVYLPTYTNFLGSDYGDRDQVLEVVRALGVPVLDFTATLRATGDPLAFYPFRLHGHFNAKGYRLLAERLAEEFLIPQALQVGGRVPGDRD